MYNAIISHKKKYLVHLAHREFGAVLEDVKLQTVQIPIPQHYEPLQSKIAGENLSGHKVVCVKSDGKVYYADSSNNTTTGILGLTTSATTINSPASIQINGELTHSGWAWIIGEPIFVGANGSLTQSVIGTAYIACIGIATVSDTINIDIHPIISYN